MIQVGPSAAAAAVAEVEAEVAEVVVFYRWAHLQLLQQ